MNCCLNVALSCHLSPDTSRLDSTYLPTYLIYPNANNPFTTPTLYLLNTYLLLHASWDWR